MTEKLHLGYKYRLYPNKDQQQMLDETFFVANQTSNILLTLWNEDRLKNKDVEKKNQAWTPIKEQYNIVQYSLRVRGVGYKTAVIQETMRDFADAKTRCFSKYTTEKRNKKISEATNDKELEKAYRYGYPKFKNSSDIQQSFSFRNQGIGFEENEYGRISHFRIFSEKIKMKYHRDFPENSEIKTLVVSRNQAGQYFVSFTMEFEKEIHYKIPENIKSSIGIDLNVNTIATSKDVSSLFQNEIEVKELHLIQNKRIDRKSFLNEKMIKLFERKNSKRVLRILENKEKLGSNFRKTQKKLNKKSLKSQNQKKDLYHKISKTIVNKFDLIAMEDLNVDKMTKSAKGTVEKPGIDVRLKSELNKLILGASFYQFASFVEYKTQHTGKLFVKVDPAYSSLECSKCGCRKKGNRPRQDKFCCLDCGYQANPDIQAAYTIEQRGLQSFGVGMTLVDSKH